MLIHYINTKQSKNKTAKLFLQYTTAEQCNVFTWKDTVLL